MVKAEAVMPEGSSRLLQAVDEIKEYNRAVEAGEIEAHDRTFSMQGLINNFLREVAGEEEANEGDAKGFRASGLGSCKLKRHWKRLGKKGDPIDDRGLRVFAVGHLFHEWLQKMTRLKGISIFSEIELEYRDPKTGKILLTGHLDDLLYVKELHALVLMDYKTVHSQKFHYLDRGEKDSHYEKQVISYMLMLIQKFPFLLGILRDLRILYVSKDDLCVREPAIIPSPEKVQSVISEIEEINEAFDAGREPLPIPEMKWECGYCTYASQCPTGQKAIAEKERKTKKTISF